MASLYQFTLTEQASYLRKQELTSAELTEHYLERISQLNPKLGAFTTITADLARQAANEADTNYSQTNFSSLLSGIPTADKDLDNRAGVPTSYGSRSSSTQPATKNDPITEAANRAGLVSLGKTHAPEFGLTGNAITDLDYQCRNPWNPEFDPGGSSSGAAVAVAAGLVPVALASDAGGSIRIPASSTGTVGFKPGRQFFSFNGQRPGNRNSVNGPIARTVADAALMMDALTAPQVHPDEAPFSQSASHLKKSDSPAPIAVIDYTPWREHFEVDLPEELQQDFEASITALHNTGHPVQRIDIPIFPGYGDAFQLLWQKSAATIAVSPENEPLLTDFTRWLRYKGSQFSETEVGNALTLMNEFERFFKASTSEFAAILTPALGLLPQKISWHDEPNGQENFIKQCLYSPYTSFVNMTGQPAIVLPTALSRDQLPMSVQLIGQSNQELELIRIAANLERELPWQLSFPKYLEG